MKENLQQIVDELKKFEGNTKGETIITDIKYIRFKEGEEGVRKVEEKMAELGVSINLNDIKPFEWINEGISAAIIVTAKEIFNWTEEDIFEMGRTAPRISFIVKLMIRHFLSLEILIQNINKYWKKHYDFGSLNPVLPVTDNKVILREEGYISHPLMCVYHAGYYQAICEFVLKNKNISVQQTACAHKGDEYNEYTIEWS